MKGTEMSQSPEYEGTSERSPGERLAQQIVDLIDAQGTEVHQQLDPDDVSCNELTDRLEVQEKGLLARMTRKWTHTSSDGKACQLWVNVSHNNVVVFQATSVNDPSSRSNPSLFSINYNMPGEWVVEINRLYEEAFRQHLTRELMDQ